LAAQSAEESLKVESLASSAIRVTAIQHCPRAEARRVQIPDAGNSLVSVTSTLHSPFSRTIGRKLWSSWPSTGFGERHKRWRWSTAAVV